jgi:hypothetical protein
MSQAQCYSNRGKNKEQALKGARNNFNLFLFLIKLYLAGKKWRLDMCYHRSVIMPPAGTLCRDYHSL